MFEQDIGFGLGSFDCLLIHTKLSYLLSKRFEKTCTQDMRAQSALKSTWRKAVWEWIIELISPFRFPFAPTWPSNSKPCPAVHTCRRLNLVYEVRAVDHGIPSSAFKLSDLTLHEGQVEKFYTFRHAVLLEHKVESERTVYVKSLVLTDYIAC